MVKRSVLSDYDEVFLDCRDIRHAWDWFGRPWRDGGEVKRRLICMRCKTQRVDTWRPSGDRVRNRYGYVDGYLISSTTGKVTARDVRLAVMDRMEIYASEEAMHKALFTNTRSKSK